MSGMMRAVVFKGADSCPPIAVEQIPQPIIEAEGDALVRIIVAGVCGSDLHAYHGREPCDTLTAFGHEGVGVVTQVGSAVKNLRVGQRVMTPFTTACGHCENCRQGLSARCATAQLLGWRQANTGLHGTQAEYIRVPNADGTLVEIPPDLHPEEGLLLGDIFSTAVFCAVNGGLAGWTESGVAADALERLLAADPCSSPEHYHAAHAKPPSRCYVVVGCGPVGLLTIIAARALLHLRGVTDYSLFAVDSVEDRLAAAALCGAVPLNGATLGDAGVLRAVSATHAPAGGGEGGPCASAVLECVGASSAIALSFSLLRPGGTLSSVGVPSAPFPFTPSQAYDKNITYRIGRCPARSLMPLSLRLLRLVKAGLAGPAVDPRTLIISHRFLLQEAVEAYELFAARQITKAVLYAAAEDRAAFACNPV